MIKKLNMKAIASLAMFCFVIVGIVSCETIWVDKGLLILDDLLH